MRKALWLISLVGLLLFGLAACSSSGDDEAPAEETTTEETTSEETGGDCASEDVLCVGLVTDVGEIDDKSFNQSAWEGVKQAESELGAQVDFIETTDAVQWRAG